MTARLGSLFSGVDGLALGIEQATGAETAWVCERDKDASAVLAERFPKAPNLNDITAVDWANVEPVDIICGGFPCQPFSTAGQRQGVSDERWMWPQFAVCVRHLRPRYVMVENVSAIVAAPGAFGRILGDLAEMRYDARWACLRAAEVGAPHRRERLFLVAEAGSGGRDGWPPRQEPPLGRGHGIPSERSESLRIAPGGDGPPPDAEEFGPVRSGATRRRGYGPADDGNVPTGGGRVDWGAYEPAIRRWEAIHGPAPAPVDERGRLGPPFVEWMMGFPPGWVTDVPISLSAQLRCLGNAVVPLVASTAWQLLI